MHTINASESESVSFSLEFTPNTGKAGDELNIAVGTMVMPSYENTYNGTKGSYGLYIYHAYNAGSGITLKMKTDAPSQQSGAVLKTEKAEATEFYKSMFPETDLDPFETDYKFLIYTDKETLEKGEDILRVSADKTAGITLEVFGKSDEYRAALFVNHQLVQLSDGSTYVDFAVDSKSVTRITLPVDISALGENNHAYVVLFRKNNGELPMTDNTYIYADKTNTHFFIVEKNSKEVN